MAHIMLFQRSKILTQEIADSKKSGFVSITTLLKAWRGDKSWLLKEFLPFNKFTFSTMNGYQNNTALNREIDNENVSEDSDFERDPMFNQALAMFQRARIGNDIHFFWLPFLSPIGLVSTRKICVCKNKTVICKASQYLMAKVWKVFFLVIGS